MSSNAWFWQVLKLRLTFHNCMSIEKTVCKKRGRDQNFQPICTKFGTHVTPSWLQKCIVFGVECVRNDVTARRQSYSTIFMFGKMKHIFRCNSKCTWYIDTKLSTCTFLWPVIISVQRCIDDVINDVVTLQKRPNVGAIRKYLFFNIQRIVIPRWKGLT